MIITIIISNIVFLLIGYYLRELRVKTIQEKVKKVEEKLRSKKSEIVEYQLPTSEREEAEKIARRNMGMV